MQRGSAPIPARFREVLETRVDARLEEYPYEQRRDAFTHVGLELFFSSLDGDAIYALVDYPRKEQLNVDAQYVNENDAIYYLFVSDLEAAGDREADRATVQKIVEAARHVIGYESYLSADEPKEEYNVIAEGYEIRLLVFTSASATRELEYALQNAISDLGAFQITGEIVNYGDLYAAYLEQIGPQGVRDSLEFEYRGSVIDCDWLEPRAVVTNIDVQSFGQTIREYIPSIFDANVRNPLGEKNKVNRNIERTLEEDEGHFWHYNNGMTILCSTVKIDSDRHIIMASEPVIVNGCQTADTITRNLSVLQEKSIDLLIRFIELPHSEPGQGELAVSIARYTNSQNPVVAADFRSNDQVQIALQHDFAHLSPPWFYERKRGEWGTVQDERKRAYRSQSGGYRRVSMDDVAQRWRAFSGYPAQAISARSSLFEQQGTYNTIFSSARSAYEYLFAYSLFDKISDRLKVKLRESRQLKNENRLDESSDLAKYYRLSRARNLAAAHLTALSADLLQRRYGTFNHSVAKRLMSQLENADLLGLIFANVERSLLDYMDLRPPRPDESMHSVLREPDTLKKLARKLDEQLTWIENSVGVDPLQRLPDVEQSV